MRRPTANHLQPVASPAEDLALMLDTEGWLLFLRLIVGQTLSKQRTTLSDRARQAIDPDLALLAVARAQARIDALIDIVYDVYDKAGIPEAEWPTAVKAALYTSGALK